MLAEVFQVIPKALSKENMHIKYGVFLSLYKMLVHDANF